MSDYENTSRLTASEAQPRQTGRALDPPASGLAAPFASAARLPKLPLPLGAGCEVKTEPRRNRPGANDDRRPTEPPPPPARLTFLSGLARRTAGLIEAEREASAPLSDAPAVAAEARKLTRRGFLTLRIGPSADCRRSEELPMTDGRGPVDCTAIDRRGMLANGVGRLLADVLPTSAKGGRLDLDVYGSRWRNENGFGAMLSLRFAISAAS